MTSIVEIANQVLDACRARATVSSIVPSDGSLAGNVLSRHFWPRVDSLARSALWNTHRTQIALTLLKARQGTNENPDGTVYDAPPWPYLYAYALPTGAAYTVATAAQPAIAVPVAPLFLRARFIQRMIAPTSAVPLMTGGGMGNGFPVGNLPPVPFLISSDLDVNGKQMKVLLTNASNAQLVYTARVSDPTLWDPNFTDAAVATVAAWCEQPITGNTAVQQGLVAMAKDLILTARITDGDEGLTMVDNTPDWMSARSGGPALITNDGYGQMWDSMAFPGGVTF